MQRPIRTTLLNGVIATGQGPTVAGENHTPSFDASLTGTGALTATVLILGRNTPGGAWSTLATLTLSGTNSAAQAAQSPGRFMEYAASVTAISGTGAAITATMAG